jgi:hypothetical protein
MFCTLDNVSSSRRLCVPWKMRPLYNVSLERRVPWTTRPLDDASLINLSRPCLDRIEVLLTNMKKGIFAYTLITRNDPFGC